MKIQSKVEHNISFFPAHGAMGMPGYITIIAGATLEFDDEVWTLGFAAAAAPAIAQGQLVILEEPKTKLTSKQIAALIEDNLGVPVNAKKPKAELQSIATKLGIDLSKPLPTED